MKVLLSIGIIAIAYAPLVFANNTDKVKIIKVIALKMNEEYVSKDTYKPDIVKVNETYNRLAVSYDILKDFPLDTKLIVHVFRSNSGSNDFKKIREYTISFCDNNDKYFKYLSNDFIELNEEGKCLPKGHYQFGDHGYFNFYDLLSEDELQNGRFKITNTFISGNIFLFNNELEFISN